LTPKENNVRATANRETAMLRNDIHIAGHFSPAQDAGCFAVSFFSTTKAKTTTKTV
jgi:hypothetical protein